MRRAIARPIAAPARPTAALTLSSPPTRRCPCPCRPCRCCRCEGAPRGLQHEGGGKRELGQPAPEKCGQRGGHVVHT